MTTTLPELIAAVAEVETGQVVGQPEYDKLVADLSTLPESEVDRYAAQAQALHQQRQQIDSPADREAVIAELTAQHTPKTIGFYRAAKRLDGMSNEALLAELNPAEPTPNVAAAQAPNVAGNSGTEELLSRERMASDLASLRTGRVEGSVDHQLLKAGYENMATDQLTALHSAATSRKLVLDPHHPIHDTPQAFDPAGPQARGNLQGERAGLAICRAARVKGHTDSIAAAMRRPVPVAGLSEAQRVEERMARRSESRGLSSGQQRTADGQALVARIREGEVDAGLVDRQG